jgi:hypothetical protein
MKRLLSGRGWYVTDDGKAAWGQWAIAGAFLGLILATALMALL